MNLTATHGLYVRAKPGLRLRDRSVQRLVRKMRLVVPWLEPSDLPACRAWAELEYLAGQVYAALKDIGPVNHQVVKDGDVSGRRLLGEYRQLRQTQLVFSRELGMTPAARMAIKASDNSAAFDLAGIAEPTSERVIEVGRARGKTGGGAEVVDGDGIQP